MAAEDLFKELGWSHNPFRIIGFPIHNVKLYKGMRVGSREQVWHGTADITAPSKKGLKKADLTMNPRGHIISKK